MSSLSALVCVSLLAIAAGTPSERIVGGTLANISQYPFAVVAQTHVNNNWIQNCGGSIINNRSVLSAAHCFVGRAPHTVRFRAGSSFASSGGSVHNSAAHHNHPHYNTWNHEHDIAVIRVSNAFNFGGNVRPGRIAGANYNVGDNQQVWVIGWGITSWGSPPSEQLRQLQIVTVSLATCQRTYNRPITENMICAGHAPGGRGPCTRDSGGPLIHHGVIVGVFSFTTALCDRPNSPASFARVSRYASWITQHS